MIFISNETKFILLVCITVDFTCKLQNFRHHISSDENHTSPDDGQVNTIRNVSGKTKRKEDQHYIMLARVYQNRQINNITKALMMG